MTTYRAHCDAILAADKWTTDRQVAADIGCAESTVSQHRRKWQKMNGVVHNNGSKPLPDDVVAFIWEMKEDEGWPWRKITRGVKETFGLKVKASRCADLYRRGGYRAKRSSPNIDPGEVVFPLETRVGIMYGPKITAPAYDRGDATTHDCCDHCSHYEQCQQANAVCRCETVQKDEVL